MSNVEDMTDMILNCESLKKLYIREIYYEHFKIPRILSEKCEIFVEK
jgi:hypothetical protein